MDLDLFVIGAGSGGVRAARVAAGLGARVAVAEDRRLGGTCVNVGCVPKKLFVYAAHHAADFQDAAGFGWTVGERAFDWRRLIANKDREIARLNGIYRRLLEDAGVHIVEGTARVVDAHTVTVGAQRFHARFLLVASGGRPALPDIPGIERAIVSDDLFHLPELPRRLLIVGGGYIAVEFASIFHGLGTEVSLLYRGPLFLRGFDTDVREILAEELRKRGLDLRFDTRVTRLSAGVGDGVCAHLEDGSTLQADAILYATGRVPRTHDLGLEQAGVKLNSKGAVEVGDDGCTAVPNIYAVGDCTDRINLTPVAIAEGAAVAQTLFGKTPARAARDVVPTAVFSDPSIGTVGLTEEQARQQFTEVKVFRSRFRPLRHTLSGRDATAFMKLIVDGASDRVVGCHVVAAEAGEIVQGFAVALRCGATKAQFDATTGLHPTTAEELVTMK